MLSAPIVSRLGLTLAALAGLATAARGGFVVIPQPNAAYLDSTTEAVIPSPGASVQSLVAGDLTITLSAPMEAVSNARLYSLAQSSRVLTFSEPLETFGVEMSPLDLFLFFPIPMKAEFFNGDMLLGTISQNVVVNSYHLFAATDTDTPFTSVQLSTSQSFGSFGFYITDVRAEVVTPEPASLVLFGVGMCGVIGYGCRRRVGSRDPHR